MLRNKDDVLDNVIAVLEEPVFFGPSGNLDTISC